MTPNSDFKVRPFFDADVRAYSGIRSERIRIHRWDTQESRRPDSGRLGIVQTPLETLSGLKMYQKCCAPQPSADLAALPRPTWVWEATMRQGGNGSARGGEGSKGGWHSAVGMTPLRSSIYYLPRQWLMAARPKLYSCLHHDCLVSTWVNWKWVDLTLQVIETLHTNAGNLWQA